MEFWSALMKLLHHSHQIYSKKGKICLLKITTTKKELPKELCWISLQTFHSKYILKSTAILTLTISGSCEAQEFLPWTRQNLLNRFRTSVRRKQNNSLKSIHANSSSFLNGETSQVHLKNPSILNLMTFQILIYQVFLLETFKTLKIYL